MFKLNVNAYQAALLYKRGALQKVYTEGSFWIGWGYKVVFKDMTLPLEDLQLELMLRNDELKNLVDVIEVKDNQLGIQYKDEFFSKVLPSGKYVYWKGILNLKTVLYNTDEVEVPESLSRKLLQTYALRTVTTSAKVESFAKGLLYIDGIFSKVLNPGVYYFWKGAKTCTVLTADLRKQMLDVNGQELLTKDKANIRINMQAQYQITDIVKALVETKAVNNQLYGLLQLGLREYVGQLTLDELLSNKSEVSDYVLKYAKLASKEMGVELLNTGIRDIILPGEMKTILNQVLIAEKKAQANVIMRREETASTRSLLNTAKLMEDNEILYKLKELESVERIAEKVSSLSVSGSGQLMNQLKEVFTTSGK